MNRRHWIAVTTACLLAVPCGLQGKESTPHEVGPRPIAERPLIGIASVDAETYVRAVRNAGGVPVVLPNTDGDTKLIDAYLQRLDGLVLPGGPDIPPQDYGEEAHPTVEPLKKNRHQFERALGKAWIRQTDKPLLGICLGGQWINVLQGGSLIQDLPSERSVNHRDTSHPVRLVADSKLAAIFGDLEFEVNSNHHQAVDKLGQELRVAARGKDGIIEAIETTDPERFLIGVQWHPERMLPDDKRQARLLEAFIEACVAARLEAAPAP